MWCQAFDLSRQFGSGVARHVIIGNHQIEWLTFKELESLDCVPGFGNGVPVYGEQQLNGFAGCLIVFDEQNATSDNSGWFHNRTNR